MTQRDGGDPFRSCAGKSRLDQLPSDEKMTAWRLAGKFTCQCREPDPELIGAFQSYECRRCRKPYFGPTRIAEELIQRVLDEVEA